MDKSVQQVDDFMKPMQKMTTEAVLGKIWPPLLRKTRSIINLAMLSAKLNSSQRYPDSTSAVPKNGLSIAEIQEAPRRFASTAVYPPHSIASR